MINLTGYMRYLLSSKRLQLSFLLFAGASLLFFIISCFLEISIAYDEVGYAHSAQYIAQHSGIVNLYKQSDVFFFPPLFNYLAAVFIKLGGDIVWSGRLLSIFFSAFAAVILFQLGEIYFNRRQGFILYFLYILSSGVVKISTVGQVETAFFSMILLSFYFITLFHKKSEIRYIIFAAIAFAVSTWIKESALGFIPALLVTIPVVTRHSFSWHLQKLKPALIFSGTILLFVIPLFYHPSSATSSSIIKEITDSYLPWDHFSLDMFIRYLISFWGLGIFFFTNFSFLSFFLFSLLIIFSVSTLKWKTVFQNKLLLFSFASLVIWVPFFISYPRKFDYYLYPVFTFTAIFSLNLLRRFSFKQLSLFFLLYVVLTAVPLVKLIRLTPYSDVKTLIEEVQPQKRVGFLLPRAAEYIVQKEKIPVEIVTVDFQKCQNRVLECMREKGVETLVADDVFLRLAYSNKFSMVKNYCDINALRAMLSQVKMIDQRGIFKLYKLK